MPAQIYRYVHEVSDFADKDTPYRYYGTLAKVMHLWREKASDAYELYKRLFCVEMITDTLAVFKQVPPKPIVGRWGQASLCEKHIDKVPEAEFRKVMRGIVEKRSTHNHMYK